MLKNKSAMGSARDFTSPVDILLVEDNPADAVLTRACLEDGGIPHRLHIVTDGNAAMAFLRHEGPYAQAPRPDIILLDLNLPGKDGREVLREVKADENLRAIPIVIHSSSGARDDVDHCYDQHANCYVVKGANFEEFNRTVRTVESFWCRTCRLPDQ